MRVQSATLTAFSSDPHPVGASTRRRRHDTNRADRSRRSRRSHGRLRRRLYQRAPHGRGGGRRSTRRTSRPRSRTPTGRCRPGTAGSIGEGRQGTEQKIEVTVTDETRKIVGIEALVVHDVVSADGELVEDTYDWYAQDANGNVWYLGEDTREYENGEVGGDEGPGRLGSTAPSRASSCRPTPRPGGATARSTTRARPRTVRRCCSLDE